MFSPQRSGGHKSQQQTSISSSSTKTEPLAAGESSNKETRLQMPSSKWLLFSMRMMAEILVSCYSYTTGGGVVAVVGKRKSELQRNAADDLMKISCKSVLLFCGAGLKAP